MTLIESLDIMQKYFDIVKFEWPIFFLQPIVQKGCEESGYTIQHTVDSLWSIQSTRLLALLTYNMPHYYQPASWLSAAFSGLRLPMPAAIATAGRSQPLRNG